MDPWWKVALAWLQYPVSPRAKVQLVKKDTCIQIQSCGLNALQRQLTRLMAPFAFSSLGRDSKWFLFYCHRVRMSWQSEMCARLQMWPQFVLYSLIWVLKVVDRISDLTTWLIWLMMLFPQLHPQCLLKVIVCAKQICRFSYTNLSLTQCCSGDGDDLIGWVKYQWVEPQTFWDC